LLLVGGLRGILGRGITMDLRVLFTTFSMIFLAELGDKTQLATLAFSAESKSRIAVFIGSASALVLTSLLAVILGSAMGRLVPANYIKTGAGALFIVLGLLMIVTGGGK
jgi:putative Ca2+/H+ antiporter (TMEM165/GDT1 family)